ncbi:ZIP family metal transporter [Paludibacter sp. 221]|uniref:ZIP family metal transporter n=1 Tax=Paludibacter sp. 221 TaxID=2302939 RepID=UPI0013D34359|nr:ZIP family metal transporter [Paludibacter sp. 221]NDV46646.1 ZIP family metal transporter [Paludibacter sp. 221]
MEKVWLFALLSAIVVSLISFIGVFLLSFRQQALKKVLVLLVSFAVGALLGNSFFHLLPEAYFHIHEISTTAWICIAGFLVFFILEQFLHVHSDKKSGGESIKNYGYLSLYADGIHNFTDGILIAVAWMFSPEMGLATTLTIVLHEIPQEIADFGVLLKAGFTRKKALLYNFVSACAAILGTVLTLWVGEQVNDFSVYVLPFAAGGFIYLAATSLLPEILKETSKKNYWLYILCILLGVFAMYYFSASGGHSHAH